MASSMFFYKLPSLKNKTLKIYYIMRIYQTNEIKNIALLGNDGSGKTTLTEALLFAVILPLRLINPLS